MYVCNMLHFSCVDAVKKTWFQHLVRLISNINQFQCSLKGLTNQWSDKW